MIDTLFVRKKTLLHRYDCRLKLILLPVFVIYYFLPLSLSFPAGLLVLSFLTATLALGLRDAVLPVRMIFPLLVLILILTPLFHREGEVLWRMGGTTVLTLSGLEETALYLVRFTGITMTFFLLFRTTSMEDLLLGLRWFRLPFIMTLVISVALRYIPHLAGLFNQVKTAHSLRCGLGDPPVRSGWLRRFRNLFPILVSLMIQSVKTIPSLTMALELKGVGRDNPRTAFRKLPSPEWRTFQIILTVSILVLVCTTLLLWL